MAYPSLIRCFVAGCILDFNAFLIRLSVTMIFIWVVAIINAWKRSFLLGDWLSGVGKDGKTPNNSSDDTSPLRRINSWIDLMGYVWFSSRRGSFILTTVNFRRRV